MQFLTSGETDETLHAKLTTIGAKQLTASSWITAWDGTADSLCRQIKSMSPKRRVVVCAFEAYSRAAWRRRKSTEDDTRTLGFSILLSRGASETTRWVLLFANV